MPNHALRMLAAVATLTFATPALAQNNTDSEPTIGSATIAAPITLTENTALRFGSLVRPTTGTSTVTLSPSACTVALSGGGNAALIASTRGCATYSVSGESGQVFDITPDATLTMTRSGGSETIVVTLTASASTGTIGQASAIFNVGGNFDIDNTTVTGAYSGEFNVVVTYQ